ncbi:MAG: hypothetical protein LC108_14280 [Anaerolineales bacterium]|nr:hypothetical protein [Anaerolineales bacterium]
MSMEDILKVLVDSRQQGNASQAGADPMASLIGGLLGGQPQSTGGAHAPVNPNAGGGSGADLVGGLVSTLLGGQPQSGGGQTSSLGGGADLSGMMGLLETFMGSQGNTSASSMGMTNNDPIMALLTPFVAPLAKKAKISPEIAMIVVSFVVHKLLAHYPTSGRDSNSFDLDNLIGQINTGKVDPGMLRQSGMVSELSQKTGLNEAQTEQALQFAFAGVGKTINKVSGVKPSSAGSKPKTVSGGSLSGARAKAGRKK